MTATLHRRQLVSEIRHAQLAMQEIVFIDSAVTDYSVLVTEMRPEVEVVVLDAARDGVEQISEVLSQRNALSAVHLVSLGSPGRLQLGTITLSLETSDRYSWQLQAWGDALANQAELLIYECEILEGERGAAFANMLCSLTGANVSASTKNRLTSTN